MFIAKIYSSLGNAFSLFLLVFSRIKQTCPHLWHATHAKMACFARLGVAYNISTKNTVFKWPHQVRYTILFLNIFSGWIFEEDSLKRRYRRISKDRTCFIINNIWLIVSFVLLTFFGVLGKYILDQTMNREYILQCFDWVVWDLVIINAREY